MIGEEKLGIGSSCAAVSFLTCTTLGWNDSRSPACLFSLGRSQVTGGGGGGGGGSMDSPDN